MKKRVERVEDMDEKMREKVRLNGVKGGLTTTSHDYESTSVTIHNRQ